MYLYMFDRDKALISTAESAAIQYSHLQEKSHLAVQDERTVILYYRTLSSGTRMSCA